VIKAVIFDLDGTLIHLPVDYEKLFRKFREILKTEKVRPVTKTLTSLDEETRKKLFEEWDKAELEALPKIRKNENGLRLYQEYSSTPKALVTMQGNVVLKKILKTLKLSFKVTVTREYSLDRIEQLKKAAEKLGVETFEDILFVGDTSNDKEAAEKLGCQFLKVKSNENMV